MNDQNDLVQSFQDKLPVQPIVTPLTNKCSNQPQKNKAYYSGKFFSILGDSISTLAGFNPDGYKLFYYGENSRRANIFTPNDTWWGKTIEFFSGKLLVNNSWSGSRVTKLPKASELFPSACSDERTSGLHDEKHNPDVIIIYLGTNDWAFGAQPERKRMGFQDEESGMFVDGYVGKMDEQVFSVAYDSMLKKIKRNYPDAEVWCCTLCKTFMGSNQSFLFPENYGGWPISDYNSIIRNSAFQNDCHLIDLFAFDLPYDSIDGSHPTEQGMQTLSKMICRSMCSDADAYLDCPTDEHQYTPIEQFTGGTKYVCEKCGKIHLENALDPSFVGETIDVTSFKLSCGDFPIIHYEYDDHSLTTYNLINGSRDGGQSLPFKTNEKIKIELDNTQINAIKRALAEFNFDSWDAFHLRTENLYAPGFCVNNSFSCRLTNGRNRSFKFGSSVPMDFKELCALLQAICKGEDVSDFTLCQPRLITCPAGHTYDKNTYHVCPYCAQGATTVPLAESPTNNPQIRFGDVLCGKYRVVGELGSGGISKVYRVTDGSGEYAAKVLDVSQIKTDVTEQIVNKFELQKSLQHNRIPKFVEMTNEDGRIIVVFELVNGTTLDRMLEKRGKPFDELTAVSICRQIAEVLAYLQSLTPPVIHRDIKPRNIMITDKGQLKLIDFDIAHTLPYSNGDHEIYGTRGYSAPEQFLPGASVDQRADVFSLGMTLYTMVTGIDPSEPPYVRLPIRRINADLSCSLEAFIEKCVDPNPDKRYRNAKELIEALDEIS